MGSSKKMCCVLFIVGLCSNGWSYTIAIMRAALVRPDFFLSYLLLSVLAIVMPIPIRVALPPISKNCIAKDVTNDGGRSEGSNGRSKVEGLYVSIVVGFVVGFWAVVALLFFVRSWRHVYYQKLDHVGRKLYVSWATMDNQCMPWNVANVSVPGA
ncbi:hypothetical protein V6N12_042674 [Hibiscus sabdariffa]|uniref:Uncharacterized protein n=1 Tax=Hibiscus sabdariffa TaxID=183260 RepID=A0ABR2AL04_9ROSI